MSVALRYLLAGCAWLGAAAWLAGAPLPLRIPAQDSARSLIALARQTEIEVVFLYEDLKRAQSPAIDGEFEPADALQSLLEGTGFVARQASPGKFVVVPQRTPPAATVARATQPLAAAAPANGSEPEPLRLAEFVVTPSRFGISEDLSPRTATFTHDEIARLPQLGEDVFRAVTRVPGLAGSDFSAKFWVRGAPHEKVLTRLDGGTLLEPFHLKDLGGALSVIDLETVSRLDLLTGGFTSEYGDRLAGVMLVETDRPVGPHPKTTLGLSMMGARGTNRGTFAGGRGAWLVSARFGYPDLTLALADAEEITPRYRDAFAKVEFDVTPDHMLAVSVLHSRDRLRYFNANDAGSLQSRYRDDYAWLRWQARFGEHVKADTVLGGAWLGWDRRSTTRPTAGNLGARRELADRRSLEQFSLRQDWVVETGPRALFRGGFEWAQGEADYRFDSVLDWLSVVSDRIVVDPLVRDLDVMVDGRTLGAFGAWRQQLSEHVVAEAGVRYDRRSYTGGAGFSPRLNLAASHGRTTWRVAWGVYRQGQGLHELPVSDGETTFATAERAQHLIVGIDRRVRPGLAWRAEIFQRTIADPRAHWENVTHPLRLTGELDFDRVRLAPTEARSRGAEFSVRGNGPRVRWSASYSWTRAEEELGGHWRPVTRDQRHLLMLEGTWSPNERWDFSAAWQYRSGWPTTGFTYDATAFGNGAVLFQPRVGELLTLRLPAYHRLDLRVTRIWRGPRSTVRAFVDVFNAYGAKNSYRYNTQVNGAGTTLQQSRSSEKSLPILPSAGVQWDF